jgi:hypothetical protein
MIQLAKRYGDYIALAVFVLVCAKLASGHGAQIASWLEQSAVLMAR